MEEKAEWIGRTYLLVKVNVSPVLLNDFNEYWAREILPFWKRNGARHLRSFIYQAGGPTGQILRLFEFDDLSGWAKFNQTLTDTDEGKEVSRQLRAKWNIVAEMTLLKPIL